MQRYAQYFIYANILIKNFSKAEEQAIVMVGTTLSRKLRLIAACYLPKSY